VSKAHSESVSTGYTHLSAIAFFYRVEGLNSPTEDKQVQMYMRGLKRNNLGKPIKQALPMTVAILKALRDLLTPAASLVTWRTVWRAHVEFLLILRFDDVKRLTRKNLTFESNTNGPFIRLKLEGKKSHVPIGKPFKNLLL